MLIIAIGHGNSTDPYTCSCNAKSGEIDPTDMFSVLNCILQKQMLNSKENVDELLVIHDDDVIAHYTWEDGLGSELA
jgi:hypothetical protein